MTRRDMIHGGPLGRRKRRRAPPKDRRRPLASASVRVGRSRRQYVRPNIVRTSAHVALAATRFETIVALAPGAIDGELPSTKLT